MSAVAIIPARFAAVRFPGKPLANRTGKPMIQHVVEQAARARRVSRVIVATDDTRIAEAVRGFGGEAIMTRADHASGTDRIAEVAGTLRDEIVLNVQGDEPEMDPENIDRLVELMDSNAEVDIGTVACPFPADRGASGPGSPGDPNCVKVVLDGCGRALYFSRALIPFPREGGGQASPASDWLLHLGLYGFRRESLLDLSRLKPTALEQTEKLEQLRWLYHGHEVFVAIGRRPSAGIDTPEDYEAFVARYRAGKSTVDS
ncbi:MAG: 3-deoxy-manno-octulosonate cytidylyltransferase [Phycisphaerae bacterium]|nr:3-deoxy-manno-octulosonate cytidylyltransferase [Phycisphaerae bacterium]NUQ44987.1 3-deoxy-manno-octulosonate cytidylyltransferase [Phycisphaerae bacterium]